MSTISTKSAIKSLKAVTNYLRMAAGSLDIDDLYRRKIIVMAQDTDDLIVDLKARDLGIIVPTYH